MGIILWGWQKVQELTQTYDTILKIPTSQESEAKSPEIEATHDTILRILTLQGKRGKKSRN